MKTLACSSTIAAFLVCVGCAPTSEQAATASAQATLAEEQAGDAETKGDAQEVPENKQAAAEATQKAGNQSSGDADSSSDSAGEKTDELPSAGEAEENFAAGIAAYQANNLPLAFQEFQAAAKKGHADSQFNLGLMYEQGIGVGRNETQAVAWYEKSATQGNSAAQFNLGVLYENGRGTKVDFARANKWYRSASVQGDPLAIGNLGMLYIRGDGVPVNKIAGVALLFVSATMDPSPDNHARRNITGTRGLSGEMIAAAQTLSGQMSAAENLLVPLDQFLAQPKTAAPQ